LGREIALSDLLRKGRLTSVRDDVVRFTSSIKDDVRIAEAVVKINRAHVTMLVEQGIIGREDGVKVLKALRGVKLRESYDPSLEDIHMYVEEEVFRAVGPEVGGNLHVAKSRNDQVATAIRMELRRGVIEVARALLALQEALVALAEGGVETIVIGHTHIQPAQPVTFGHHLLSYVDALERDMARIREAYSRINRSPMGAGALAGTSFPISRERVAELLGFEGLVENSVDAVGTRDFLVEALWCLSVMAVDIGRIVEDLILWSSYHFGLIELPDDFASTSSIMPQKKNPDILEVIRARMKQVIGSFITSLNTVMSLPSSYNLDFQEITPLLWRSIDQTVECTSLLARLVPHLEVREETAVRKAAESLSTSTELANLMVRKYHVPFRTAHMIVGAVTRHLVDKEEGRPSALTSELVESTARSVAGLELRMDEDEIRSSLDPVGFVRAHKTRGGPAPEEVERMLRERLTWIASSKKWIEDADVKLRRADQRLSSAVESLTSGG